MSIERKGEDEVKIFNALSDHGFPLRIMRVRGILHVGVIDNFGKTTWSDVDIDSLIEGLAALGINIYLT